VKIPATAEGLSAITRTLVEGISVNVTFIFSPNRYREATEAFFTGLEQARDNGYHLGRIQSVVCLFVSRIDTEVDARLGAVPGGDATKLRGQAALATARLVDRVYEELYTTERWQALAAAGATPQRLIWASTTVASPSYPDTTHADRPGARGIVDTPRQNTPREFADHGAASDSTLDGESIRRSTQEMLDRLSAAGIDLNDVCRTLENESVEKSTQSWLDLLDTVQNRLAHAKAGPPSSSHTFSRRFQDTPRHS
jgi:transaldolase